MSASCLAVTSGAFRAIFRLFNVGKWRQEQTEEERVRASSEAELTNSSAGSDADTAKISTSFKGTDEAHLRSDRQAKEITFPSLGHKAGQKDALNATVHSPANAADGHGASKRVASPLVIRKASLRQFARSGVMPMPTGSQSENTFPQRTLTTKRVRGCRMPIDNADEYDAVAWPLPPSAGIGTAPVHAPTRRATSSLAPSIYIGHGERPLSLWLPPDDEAHPRRSVDGAFEAAPLVNRRPATAVSVPSPNIATPFPGPARSEPGSSSAMIQSGWGNILYSPNRVRFFLPAAANEALQMDHYGQLSFDMRASWPYAQGGPFRGQHTSNIGHPLPGTTSTAPLTLNGSMWGADGWTQGHLASDQSRSSGRRALTLSSWTMPNAVSRRSPSPGGPCSFSPLRKSPPPERSSSVGPRVVTHPQPPKASTLHPAIRQRAQEDKTPERPATSLSMRSSPAVPRPRQTKSHQTTASLWTVKPHNHHTAAP